LVVDGKVVIGFDKARINALLDLWLRQYWGPGVGK
jgi:hypothetical protein